MRPNQRGFTMIELLVGMVIALLATLIIMQVYELFEGQKRTTTGGADAQTNGSIALFNIQREVAMAGYGLPVFSTSNPALLCEPLPTIDHDGNGATPQIGMYPALVQDGGVGPGASDTIILTYGDTATGGVPTTSGSVVGNVAVVDSNLACRANDIALLIKGSACDLDRVANLIGTTGITFQNIPTVTSGIVACLGGWNEISYAVVNNALARNGVANVAGIVNIQAQYGIRDYDITPPNPLVPENQIDRWVDPVDIAGTKNYSLTMAGNTLVNPPLADRNRIKAIRVAVVARSGLWERGVVSAACSSTTAANPTGVCAWEGNPASPAPAIDLSNDPDWQNYRYRVFEVIIPLRNVIWSFNTLT
ncbi:MAG: prepilin-type N-terminal cleavage/methylation domain-containing protein [Rhodocyclaceae bacterium]|nr:prepilin-type N-terminal cleavage/methylation domain-containing protein [Rhodocyclaceae bacterium]